MAKTDAYKFNINNKEKKQMMLEAYKIAYNKGLLTTDEKTEYNNIMKQPRA